MTPQAFKARWTNHRLTEEQGYQRHFNDLCALAGFTPPDDSERFTFQKRVVKSGGEPGKADVWLRDHFGWEYKSTGGSLQWAYRQLNEYRDGLDNPPLLVVSDMNVVEVHTAFTGTTPAIHRFDTASIALPDTQLLLRAIFFEPSLLDPSIHRELITRGAARHVATVFDSLVAGGIDPHQAAYYLMRVVFCMFAEDVGLLPQRMIERVLNESRTKPEHFSRVMENLFTVMKTGGNFGIEVIREFDGGLFDDCSAVTVRAVDISALCAMARLDWSKVEPAIFGGLLEGALSHDAAKRGRLGAHYTARSEIELIVEPVLLDPLRAEWADVQRRCDELAAEPRLTGSVDRQVAPTASLPSEELDRFRERLGSIRILDPACGSGNFLYVALAGLLDLEEDVRQAAPRWGVKPDRLLLHVGPRQLHGLDVDPWAAALASTTVWIGYLQWRYEHNGIGEEAPLLQPLDTIHEMDAVLTPEGGEPLWPAADVIIGNPPFLGGKRLRAGLGDEYVDRLFACYEGRVPREADLCCYWHEKARAAIQTGRAKRAGLLATNSIRQGPQMRPVVQKILDTGGIFMAWSDREWREDGAAVRIAVLGFDDGSQQERMLDGQPVARINADLTSGLNLSLARPLAANAGIAFMGDTKGGAFDIPGSLARRMLAAPNPLGRDNADVVKPWYNGLDVTRRPRDRWIIDFGCEMSETDAALYEVPFEYVREHVLPVRQHNSRESYRAKWWLHVEPRSGMRAALTGLGRYLATPQVARHRVFAWLGAEVLPDHKLIVMAQADDGIFGVLHSRVHEHWSLRTCSWQGVGNDPVYTPTTCFDTFPFPDPTPTQRETISAAAKALHETRQSALDSNPELTLTELYNQRPTWLANLHDSLDAAVLDAYGWPADIGDEELLERLLALNLERAAREREGELVRP